LLIVGYNENMSNTHRFQHFLPCVGKYYGFIQLDEIIMVSLSIMYNLILL